MSTSYRPVNWANEFISSDKLNQMAANDQYLFERTPTVYYNSSGVSKRTGGMKIMSGTVIFPINKRVSTLTKEVHFGSFFSQGCRPVVTTGMCMTSGGRYNITVASLGNNSALPDHRGVRFRVIANPMNSKDNKVLHKVVVSWTAVGY